MCVNVCVRMYVRVCVHVCVCSIVGYIYYNDQIILLLGCLL